jgi:hypothetical protein
MNNYNPDDLGYAQELTKLRSSVPLLFAYVHFQPYGRAQV